jgi:hypothetical protein
MMNGGLKEAPVVGWERTRVVFEADQRPGRRDGLERPWATTVGSVLRVVSGVELPLAVLDWFLTEAERRLRLR